MEAKENGKPYSYLKTLYFHIHCSFCMVSGHSSVLGPCVQLSLVTFSFYGEQGMDLARTVSKEKPIKYSGDKSYTSTSKGALYLFRESAQASRSQR